MAHPARTAAPSTQPLVDRVEVRDFRSIREATLALGRVTVLVGANGSGKSNVLEAIAVGGAAVAGRLSHEFLAARGIRPVPVELLTPRYAGHRTAEQALLAFSSDDGHRVEAQVGVEASGQIGCALQLEGARVSETRARTVEEMLELRANVVPHLSRFLVFSPEYGALRTFEGEGQVLPLGVRGEGLFEHLIALSRDAAWLDALNRRLEVLDWFGGIAPVVDSGVGQRRLVIRDRYLQADVTLDQRSTNEGFLFLLFVYVLMTSPHTPRFFAIDNADASLNPKLCARLVSDIVELARLHDKQVILTTHNPAMLDGLDLTDDEQRLFVCERDLDGGTGVRRIAAPKTSARLSEAFLRGYLGGLPSGF